MIKLSKKNLANQIFCSVIVGIVDAEAVLLVVPRAVPALHPHLPAGHPLKGARDPRPVGPAGPTEQSQLCQVPSDFSMFIFRPKLTETVCFVSTKFKAPASAVNN